MAKPKLYNVRLSLQEGDNKTYSATFQLELPESPAPANDTLSAEREARLASYYVASVFLIYGLSIVLLIASSIRRKRHKQLQDQQINKYLREFQVVQETSSKSHYRQLKHIIAAKLEALPRSQTGGGGTGIFTHAGLSHVMPLAIGLPLAHWPQGKDHMTAAPQSQRQLESVDTRHTSESEFSDDVRESSYDADVSSPTSPNYGDGRGFGETSPDVDSSVWRPISSVDSTKSSLRPTPDIVIYDRPKEDVLPNDKGLPFATTNAEFSVELGNDEHRTLLHPSVSKTSRPDSRYGRVEFIPGEPVRETIV